MAWSWQDEAATRACAALSPCRRGWCITAHARFPTTEIAVASPLLQSGPRHRCFWPDEPDFGSIGGMRNAAFGWSHWVLNGEKTLDHERPVADSCNRLGACGGGIRAFSWKRRYALSRRISTAWSMRASVHRSLASPMPVPTPLSLRGEGLKGRSSACRRPARKSAGRWSRRLELLPNRAVRIPTTCETSSTTAHRQPSLVRKAGGT